MSIEIIIKGDNAAQAHQEFVGLHALFTGSANVAAPAAQEVSKASKPRQERSKSETVKEEPTVKQAVQEESQDENAAGGPVPTVVDLRAKAQEVGAKDGGRAAVKALLEQFSSKSISDIPDGQRVAFMEELEALL
ncbi:hypothetical protein [Paenibacillus sp. y28]|uniref:hypothetical protein n=1 Tax=Paenibacillus sp. y28 TaxID=3129110 RepID=UPI00301A0E09